MQSLRKRRQLAGIIQTNFKAFYQIILRFSAYKSQRPKLDNRMKIK